MCDLPLILPFFQNGFHILHYHPSGIKPVISPGNQFIIIGFPVTDMGCHSQRHSFLIKMFSCCRTSDPVGEFPACMCGNLMWLK
jgi:hypothetical protein